VGVFRITEGYRRNTGRIADRHPAQRVGIVGTAIGMALAVPVRWPRSIRRIQSRLRPDRDHLGRFLFRTRGCLRCLWWCDPQRSRHQRSRHHCGSPEAYCSARDSSWCAHRHRSTPKACRRGTRRRRSVIFLAKICTGREGRCQRIVTRCRSAEYARQMRID
jgi:hypothetical protein